MPKFSVVVRLVLGKMGDLQPTVAGRQVSWELGTYSFFIYKEGHSLLCAAYRTPKFCAPPAECLSWVLFPFIIALRPVSLYMCNTQKNNYSYASKYFLTLAEKAAHSSSTGQDF